MSFNDSVSWEENSPVQDHLKRAIHPDWQACNYGKGKGGNLRHAGEASSVAPTKGIICDAHIWGRGAWA